MKILVICQYYYPEPFRISDICEELVKKGHEVFVVTGIPNYPEGKIYKGYRFEKKRDEIINGVRVHRCFTIGRGNNIIFRFLNYYSYSFFSTIYVSFLREKFDVVFVNQLSPVMMAKAGIKYKKRHNVPLVMYSLDLWPESLVAGGISRGSLIYKFFHSISKKLYMQADKILITSKSFADYFEKEFNIMDTCYMPQYAESIFTSEQCQKKPNGYVDLMFAGNIGEAQSVETIIEAARLTTDIANLRWHIVGGGSKLENLKINAKDMKNVIFHGRKSLDEMPKYYAMADAMLVTMKKDPILNLTLPGKVQTYMAAGKPILGAIDGEASFVITDANCGICVAAEEAQLLSESVKKFVEVDKDKMCINARRYYDVHFNKQIFIDRLEVELTHIK